MVEDNSNASKTDAVDAKAEEGSGPDGKSIDRDWKAEFEEAALRRDSFAKRARQAEKRVEELEASLTKDEKDKALKSGSIEKLKEAFQAELEKERTEKETVAKKYHEAVLETRVKQMARPFLIESETAVEDFWRLAQGDFELEEDEVTGKDKVVVKGNSFASIEEHIKRFLEQRPFLMRNARKAGTGMHKPLDGIKPEELTLEDIARNPERAKELFRKRPDLAAQYLDETFRFSKG